MYVGLGGRGDLSRPRTWVHLVLCWYALMPAALLLLGALVALTQSLNSSDAHTIDKIEHLPKLQTISLWSDCAAAGPLPVLVVS